MSRLAPIGLFTLVAIGCGGQVQDQGLTAEVVKGRPDAKDATETPAYDIEFLQPIKSAYRPGEKLECRFSIAIPPGTHNPTFVVVLIKRDQAGVLSEFADLKEAQPGRMIFGKSLDLPTTPGTYTIQVDATLTRVFQDGEDDQFRSIPVSSRPERFIITKDE